MTAADRAAAAREELAETLEAIEDRFNVPKQSKLLADKVARSYEENPVPWIIGATAATLVVAGLVAWAIFGSDD